MRPDRLQAEGHDRLAPLYTPLAVTERCSCGFSERQTRKQNALAREAKLLGAWNTHIRAAKGDG